MLIENHSGINVLRDDILPGGTKSIFLPALLDVTKDYYVYASPVYGGLQIALALYCKSIGKQAVIFCAKRKEPHNNTLKAKAAGAIVYQVPYGYLSNCQAKAKEFVQKDNAQLIAFGADYPLAVDAIANRMRLVIKNIGQEPDEIFCSIGSGTLVKGILKGTATATITGVQVGAGIDIKNERLKVLKYPKPFAYESKIKLAFPSCANYDLKAWEFCLKFKKLDNTFFWNVM